LHLQRPSDIKRGSPQVSILQVSLIRQSPQPTSSPNPNKSELFSGLLQSLCDKKTRLSKVAYNYTVEYMSSKSNITTPHPFAELGLTPPLLRSLEEAGYEHPTPIQAEMIPHMMDGRDVIGQAQTGTGKTAAFALPLLARLETGKIKSPQVLVLTPTRELAIQVADSFKSYGKYMKNFRVLPVFGGQDYSLQIKELRRGVQVVVGTPGRIMDHIRKNNLNLKKLTGFILDEADEMLKMGFIDDIQWILKHIPEERQTALFSATMPHAIKQIAHKYQRNPVEITIKTKTVTAKTINQRYLITNGFSKKFDALSRVMETEDFDGMLIFVRTKIQTVELAEKLSRLGYGCAALNGDIQQSQRIRTVEQLKTKGLDILVATDVAARGLDVERISHVINFDIPFDNEAYIHRIGRTGRAGRKGEAILFINPREKGMLRSIERLTKQKINRMELPSIKEINLKRVAAFKRNIGTAMEQDISFYRDLINSYLTEHNAAPEDVAAALASLVQGSGSMLLSEPKVQTRQKKRREPVASAKSHQTQLPPEEGMERYRIEVGKSHGVKPGNIVGAIAGEADISSSHIGRITIFDSHSTVDLPLGMPGDIFTILTKTWINNRPLKISKIDAEGSGRKKNQNSVRQKPVRRTRTKSGKGRQHRHHAGPML
jgi:ATP-dependent RNA helicase DeaD